MAIATNTSLPYSSVAIREQLADVIYNIAPLDTPFFSGCSREKLRIPTLNGRQILLPLARQIAS